jgi:putative Mg2+ transporter-C (MgtC) family protein
MQLFDPDLLWPIVGAIAAGGVIGAEREYRASPAGFRTHILVCLSSALLMLAAVHQVRWLTDTPPGIIRIDPVRMAHGVLTGIGFLCGGVIFREGSTVRGLTTAASLWSTSSLGILFGVGFYGLALTGALATLLVLAAVSLTEAVLPQRQYADVKLRYRSSAAIGVREFRDLLVAHALRPQAINQVIEGDALEFSTTVGGYSEARAQALATAIRAEPFAEAFECLPHKT